MELHCLPRIELNAISYLVLRLGGGKYSLFFVVGVAIPAFPNAVSGTLPAKLAAPPPVPAAVLCCPMAVGLPGRMTAPKGAGVPVPVPAPPMGNVCALTFVAGGLKRFAPAAGKPEVVESEDGCMPPAPPPPLLRPGCKRCGVNMFAADEVGVLA